MSIEVNDRDGGLKVLVVRGVKTFDMVLILEGEIPDSVIEMGDWAFSFNDIKQAIISRHTEIYP